MGSYNSRNFLSKLPNLTAFTFVVVFLYIPILLLIIFSFNDSKIVSSWKGFTFKYYILLFQNKEVLIAFKNTMVVALISTLVATLLGILGALALENIKFSGRKVFSFLVLINLIMPDILMGVSLALLYNFLKIQTGILTVVIAHITFCLAYTIIVIRSRLEGFDNRLLEAAMDLGANRWQIFYKIKFPLMLPGIVAAALLAFTLSIDDFIITFFTSGRGFTTLPIYVEGAIRRGTMTTINVLSTLMIFGTFFLAIVTKHIRKYLI